jgi:kanamycin kinase
VNEVGGVTVRGRFDGERVYAKWAPPGTELDLRAEAERLEWAAPFLRVPDVLELFADGDGEVLITRALRGENAVTERWRSEPRRAAPALGAGQRAHQEALAGERCPIDRSIDERVSRSRLLNVPERAALLERLGAPPSVDRLVVCHGDACAPNTLLADDGTIAGFVDLGSLGAADRWADIAVGAWSTEWNYGDGYLKVYYDAYGVEPDEERIAFYRTLWDAT